MQSIPKSRKSALNSNGAVATKFLVTSGHAFRGQKVYYCGSQRVGNLCKKCDGTCGPTNGCNCFPCSQLTALNAETTKNSARKKTHLSFDNVHTNSYRHYCGSYLNAHNCGHCNLYCGPFNGCQCEYCKMLDPPVPLSMHQPATPSVITETFIILGDQPTVTQQLPSPFVNQSIAPASIISERGYEVCGICGVNPKNGVLIHGDTGHQFCCYECGKLLQRNRQPCPICVQEITHVITVYRA